MNKQRRGADDEARDERARRRDVRREGFRGPAADTRLGEAFLDAIPIVAAVGFAADVSQCVQLCGTTFRAGDRGATNDMLVQSQRLQCGAREAHAAGREQFAFANRSGALVTFERSTQLIRAAMLNNLPRVLQLVQLGAPLNVVDMNEFYGYSALHWACRLGHDCVARALLDGKYDGRGAMIDLRSKRGSWTPLMEACDFGRDDVVCLLLSRGAKQKLQDAASRTALHWAVLCNHPSVVALLCATPDAAAVLALKTNAAIGSLTPLAMAVHLGNAACEAVLRAHGAST